MPRRPPAAVRATLPPRTKSAVLDGISARTAREILYFERARLWPGAVASALAEWKQAVRRPAHLLRDLIQDNCICCEPLQHRDTLARVLVALSPRARRELQSRLDPMDKAFRHRTHDDPAAPPDLPWWHRRA